MVKEASLEFTLRKIDETSNDLLDEIKHNDLISEKYKKACKYINYVDYLLILVSATTGYVSISTFAWLVTFAVGIQICATTAEIKKYMSII